MGRKKEGGRRKIEGVEWVRKERERRRSGGFICGDIIKAEPRTTLRHGASSCGAKVDFKGRCRWY